MSKYDNLWLYIKRRNSPILKLTFDEVENILNFKIDHSFLNYKKELLQYGYFVDKISLKEKCITIKKNIENN